MTQVLAALNTKLKADLNATVTVNWIGWGDFTTKYPLVLASGEPVDMIYAATWTNFYQNAQKGAYLALEDLAPKYAPKSMASYSPDWLAQATVNGHLYAFPANFSQVGMMGYHRQGRPDEEVQHSRHQDDRRLRRLPRRDRQERADARPVGFRRLDGRARRVLRPVDRPLPQHHPVALLRHRHRQGRRRDRAARDAGLL